MSLRGPFRRTPYDWPILALAAPALGTLAADPLVSLVDTAFVGRLGAAPLAALGINTALFSLFFFAFNFLAYGTTPLVGRAVGAGDREAATRVVLQAVAIGTVCGVASTAVLEVLADPMVRLMGAGPELAGPATGYLRIRALAAPAVLLVLAGHGAFRGYQDTRTPLVVTMGLNAVNLVLDPLLIFGAGWGLAGAAWATTVAQWSGAGAFLVLLRRGAGLRWSAPGLRGVGAFLRVGGALTARTLALLATLTLATAVAARVGVVAVAAHQVAAQLWTFLALVVDALAIAGQALVSRYLGEGDPASARRASWRMLEWGLLLGLGLAAAFWWSEGLLPSLFTDDPEVAGAIRSVWPFVALMQPLNALVFVWDGLFMGAEDFGYLARAMALSGAAAWAMLLAVLPLGWGLEGVWWGMTVLMVVRAATLAWRFASASGPLTPG